MNKRKYVLSIGIIAIITLFSLVPDGGFTGNAFAWDDCPKGLVDDHYPGECPRYVDTDGNGICDHSEPAPEDRVDNTQVDTVQAIKSDTKNDVQEIQDVQSVKENKSDRSKILGIFAVVIPLTSLTSYAGYRKHKVNKEI